MNFFDLLRRGGLKVSDLRQILQFVADSGSELAPLAAELLTKLEGGVPAEKLAELISVLPGEFLNVAQLKLDGRFHPGGAA